MLYIKIKIFECVLENCVNQVDRKIKFIYFLFESERQIICLVKTN